jgi:thioredoxin reductase (NADPH)
VDLDENNYIVAKNNMETNVPGVYAAGDVVQKCYRYLTTAMADGTIAALAAEKYIRTKLENELYPTRVPRIPRGY